MIDVLNRNKNVYLFLCFELGFHFYHPNTVSAWQVFSNYSKDSVKIVSSFSLQSGMTYISLVYCNIAKVWNLRYSNSEAICQWMPDAIEEWIGPGGIYHVYASVITTQM